MKITNIKNWFVYKRRTIRNTSKNNSKKQNTAIVSQIINEVETAPSSQSQTNQNNLMEFQNTSDNNLAQNSTNSINLIPNCNPFAISNQFFLLIPINVLPRVSPIQNIFFSRITHLFNVPQINKNLNLNIH